MGSCFGSAAGLRRKSDCRWIAVKWRGVEVPLVFNSLIRSLTFLSAGLPATSSTQPHHQEIRRQPDYQETRLFATSSTRPRVGLQPTYLLTLSPFSSIMERTTMDEFSLSRTHKGSGWSEGAVVEQQGRGFCNSTVHDQTLC